MLERCGVRPGQRPQDEGQDAFTFSCQQEDSAAVEQLEYLSVQSTMTSAGQPMDSSPILATANLTSDIVRALSLARVPVGFPLKFTYGLE